jgi:hypothetical protein
MLNVSPVPGLLHDNDELSSSQAQPLAGALYLEAMKAGSALAG